MMMKGLQTGILKTVKKNKASPFFTDLHSTEYLMLSRFASFGSPLLTPLIRGFPTMKQKQKFL